MSTGEGRKRLQLRMNAGTAASSGGSFPREKNAGFSPADLGTQFPRAILQDDNTRYFYGRLLT